MASIHPHLQYTAEDSSTTADNNLFLGNWLMHCSIIAINCNNALFVVVVVVVVAVAVARRRRASPGWPGLPEFQS